MSIFLSFMARTGLFMTGIAGLSHSGSAGSEIGVVSLCWIWLSLSYSLALVLDLPSGIQCIAGVGADRCRFDLPSNPSSNLILVNPLMSRSPCLVCSLDLRDLYLFSRSLRSRWGARRKLKLLKGLIFLRRTRGRRGFYLSINLRLRIRLLGRMVVRWCSRILKPAPSFSWMLNMGKSSCWRKPRRGFMSPMTSSAVAIIGCRR